MEWTLIVKIHSSSDEKPTIETIRTGERFTSKTQAEERKKEIEKEGYYQGKKVSIVLLDELI